MALDSSNSNSFEQLALKGLKVSETDNMYPASNVGGCIAASLSGKARLTSRK